MRAGEFTHLVDDTFLFCSQVQGDCTSQTRILNYCRMTGALYNWYELFKKDEFASMYVNMVQQSFNKVMVERNRYVLSTGRGT